LLRWWPLSAPPERTLWYYEQMHTIIATRLVDSRVPARLGHVIAQLREVRAA